jgi:hypothetical protein
MSSQGRWALVVGSLLAVSALGTWGCCTAGPGDSNSKIVFVKVTSSGVSLDPIPISKKKHQQIVWKLQSGSPYTTVAIPLGTHPEDPFVNCRTSAGVCQIDCEHGYCFSGSINPVLPVPEPIYYDYHFESGGGVTSSDPGIRIDP